MGSLDIGIAIRAQAVDAVLIDVDQQDVWTLRRLRGASGVRENDGDADPKAALPGGNGAFQHGTTRQNVLRDIWKNNGNCFPFQSYVI